MDILLIYQNKKMHKINPDKKTLFIHSFQQKLYREKYKLIFKYLYSYFSGFRNQTRKKKKNYHESVYSLIVSPRGCKIYDG